MLIVLIGIMVTASGCEVAHDTEVNSITINSSMEKISELRTKQISKDEAQAFSFSLYTYPIVERSDVMLIVVFVLYCVGMIVSDKLLVNAFITGIEEGYLEDLEAGEYSKYNQIVQSTKTVLITLGVILIPLLWPILWIAITILTIRSIKGKAQAFFFRTKYIPYNERNDILKGGNTMARKRNLLVSLGILLIAEEVKTLYSERKELKRIKKLEKDIEESEEIIILIKREAQASLSFNFKKGDEKMSIQINFKQVCHTCPHRKTQIDENVAYSDNQRYAVNTLISCEHEKVCKMYIEWEGPTITEALDQTTKGGKDMGKYPCRDCEERHFACWDRCDKYQTAKSIKIPEDVVETYYKAKGKYYKTKYGWRI